MTDQEAHQGHTMKHRPTLRGALLWAVVGAALFLGVGATLPVWPTETVAVGPPGTAIQFERGQGTVWESARSFGLVSGVALGVAVLLGGGVAGVLARLGFLALSRRKGGGA